MSWTYSDCCVWFSQLLKSVPQSVTGFALLISIPTCISMLTPYLAMKLSQCYLLVQPCMPFSSNQWIRLGLLSGPVTCHCPNSISQINTMILTCSAMEVYILLRCSQAISWKLSPLSVCHLCLPASSWKISMWWAALLSSPSPNTGILQHWAMAAIFILPLFSKASPTWQWASPSFRLLSPCTF